MKINVQLVLVQNKVNNLNSTLFKLIDIVVNIFLILELIESCQNFVKGNFLCT